MTPAEMIFNRKNMREKKEFSEGMIDISGKAPTRRIAEASVELQLSKDVFRLVMEKGSKKGDIFEVSKVAGIMAAKSTATIIPMCHPISLSKVNIAFEIDEVNFLIRIFSEVVCTDKTGVEMEALTAASVAALTIYDMLKYADKGMVISDLKLLKKSGGKSGDYFRNKKEEKGQQ